MASLSARQIFYSVLVLHLFLVVIKPIDDPDFWWHLRTGQHIFQTLSIPRTDIYSFTAFGQPWVAHEWLSETVIYSIYRLSGWLGLIVCNALLTATVFVYVASHSKAPPQVVLLATFISQAAALVVLTNPQPRLATLFLSAVFFIALRSYTNGDRKKVWLLPPLTILWVNLHAGYPLGLLFIVLAVLSLLLTGNRDRVNHLLMVFCLCAIAIAINPNGVRMFSYPFETQFSPVQMFAITEWRSPDFRAHDALPFLFLLLTLVGTLALSKRRSSWFDLLCLLLALVMSLRSFRHVSVLSIVSIPILAEHSWDWISSTPYGKRISSGSQSNQRLLPSLLILTVLIIHLPAVLRTIRSPVNLDKKPVASLKFIEEQNLPNNLFSTYEWNDYIIWNAPERKVFIDGRADMYGDEFLSRAVLLYIEGKDWEELFQRFDVRTALLEQSSPLAPLLKRNSEWSEVYNDQQAIVFVKK